MTRVAHVPSGCGDQLPVPLYDGISPGVEALWPVVGQVVWQGADICIILCVDT